MLMYMPHPCAVVPVTCPKTSTRSPDAISAGRCSEQLELFSIAASWIPQFGTLEPAASTETLHTPNPDPEVEAEHASAESLISHWPKSEPSDESGLVVETGVGVGVAVAGAGVAVGNTVVGVSVGVGVVDENRGKSLTLPSASTHSAETQPSCPLARRTLSQSLFSVRERISTSSPRLSLPMISYDVLGPARTFRTLARTLAVKPGAGVGTTTVTALLMGTYCLPSLVISTTVYSPGSKEASATRKS